MRMFGAFLLAIFLAIAGIPIDHTQAQNEKLVEEGIKFACPHVVRGAALLAFRNKVTAEEFAKIGDFACAVRGIVYDVKTKNPGVGQQIPLSRETAERFICSDLQYAKYCEKDPVVPPSFKSALQGAREDYIGSWAAKCVQARLNAQDCTASMFSQALEDTK